jgi:hypothetical protein
VAVAGDRLADGLEERDEQVAARPPHPANSPK